MNLKKLNITFGIIFNIALVCFLFFVSSAFAIPKGTPKLYVKNATYDFGSLSEGSRVEHTFELQNTGNDDLHIKQTVSSCGCAVADTAKKVLKPGEKTNLKVVFRTTGFSGNVSKAIRLYTNALGAPEKLFILKGNVITDVLVMPTRLSFGVKWYKNIRDREAYSDVVIDTAKDVKILDSYRMSKYLDVDVLEKTDNHLKLRVFLKDTIPVGEFRDRIVVDLKGSNKKSIDIPVFARVQSDVYLTPIAVSFGVLDGGVKERVVKINNLTNKYLKIEKLKTSNKKIKLRVNETEAGKSYDLVLSVDSAQIKEDIKAIVRVFTNIEDCKELKLSVYGLAR
ncbi:MAG: DUF1573 domain-containing protein [Bdellovibrionota bacterium]